MLSLIMRNRWLLVKFSFAHAKLTRSKIIRLLTLRTVLSYSWSDMCCFVVDVNENLLFLFSHLIESSSSTQLVLLEFSQILISVWMLFYTAEKSCTLFVFWNAWNNTYKVTILLLRLIFCSLTLKHHNQDSSVLCAVFFSMHISNVREGEEK